MTRTATRALTGVLLAGALAACGGGGTPSGAPATSAAPSPSPTASPSPFPSLPPVAADKAAAKDALVTVAELGKPWVQPKSVRRVEHATNELCPGQPNSLARTKPRASQKRAFTEGPRAGASIASFSVRVYEWGQEGVWRQGAEDAARACPQWRAVEGNYVTLEVVASPPSVAGADEVFAHVERIWADKEHTVLQYVRHYLEARTGRAVSAVELAFVQPSTDPKGDDLTAAAKLLAKQVAKTRKAFPR